MTIVSHEHKFIFLKTMKTAGTSVEMALAPHLGDDDTFSSGQIVHDAGYRKRHHAKTRIHHFRPADLVGVVRGLMDDQFHRNRGDGTTGRWKRLLHLRQHASACEVQRFVGRVEWNDYWKVCFERNPWDRMLSYYFFRKKAHGFEFSFEEWLRAALAGGERDRRRMFAQDVRNDQIYSIGKSIAVNRVYRYEDIDESFRDIAKRLNLQDTSLSKQNVGVRPEGRVHEFYTPELQALVAEKLELEVCAGNYTFPLEGG